MGLGDYLGRLGRGRKGCGGWGDALIVRVWAKRGGACLACHGALPA
ncbi:MAG TPA: hypothetical protein VN821_09545 [Candidatus Udaeobacter sp.]|nr:hypothetical protein [Candidatus Udaeobacter sp.]